MAHVGSHIGIGQCVQRVESNQGVGATFYCDTGEPVNILMLLRNGSSNSSFSSRMVERDYILLVHVRRLKTSESFRVLAFAFRHPNCPLSAPLSADPVPSE